MPHSPHQASVASGVAKRVRSTRAGRKLVRGGYLTPEIVVMWAAYVFTIVGNAVIEAGQVGGVTSATVAYGVFTWFTPAGYVFSIWTLIYVALAAWLVAYTRDAPTRPKRVGPTAVLFAASSVLNVLWLALWHFQMVAASFVVIVAEWCVLVALYLRVRKSAGSVWGWAPISIYTAWVTVATLANLAILITRALDGGIPVLNDLSAIALTAGVLVLGYLMKDRFGDVAFPLVFLWALVGVGAHVAQVSWLTAAVVYLLCAIGAVATFVPLARLRGALRG